jgi:hypothetical protein
LPNRGLEAVTLILCIAFVLRSAFARLHSKLFRRYRLSMLEVSRQLYRSLWSLQPRIRAQTDNRFALLLILITASPTADSAARRRPCPQSGSDPQIY